MNLQQRDLVLIPYPFTNLEEKKVRPAVIVSNKSFNEKCNDCIMVPLTSVIRENPFSVMISQENMDKGRLLKTSEIRIDKIFSIEKRLVRIKVGSVSNGFFNKIKQKIMESI